jgi:hypothetical protein
MRFELSTDSHVLVDLRAAGLFKALGHDVTLSARQSRPRSIWTMAVSS